jgi:hypothetical protein
MQAAQMRHGIARIARDDCLVWSRSPFCRLLPRAFAAAISIAGLKTHPRL